MAAEDSLTITAISRPLGRSITTVRREVSDSDVPFWPAYPFSFIA